MKPAVPQINQEQLKKFVREVTAGDYIFHQSDVGNTMFVIVEGTVDLLETRGPQEFVVGTLRNGQVLGEKAMLTEKPYSRTYSARAKTETVMLEFTNKHLKIVETIIPDFASRILQIAAQRLDRANRVMTILRSMDPCTRIVQTIQLLTEEGDRRTSEGVEVSFDLSEIEQICSVDMQIIQECVDALTDARILRKTKTGYLITDPYAVLQFLPDLQERIAA